MISYISPLKKVSCYKGDQKRKLAILGSTGSIGRNVLEVVSQHKDKFEVVALGAGKNIKLLAEQILFYKPKYIAVFSEKLALQLKEDLKSKKLRLTFLWGDRGYEEIASLNDVDIVVNGISGASGLKPLIASLKKGKIIALANKESLVLAGSMVRKLCSEYGSEILPVDSEHNAIFQCLMGHNFDDVLNLWLTASGGPFWNKSVEFLSKVTPEMALKHPNWEMGRKITVDSATLMNKALEVIEAYHLFGIELDRIKVAIHPQSIVHSFVEYVDGSFIAHMSVPDMKLPIAYCLLFPKRAPLNLNHLNLLEVEKLTFLPVDHKKFPSINLARYCLKMGESYPIVLNGANEIAVEMFLKGKISFLKIFDVIKRALDDHKPVKIQELEDVLEVDKITREKVTRWLA